MNFEEFESLTRFTPPGLRDLWNNSMRLFYAMGGSVSAGKSNDELIDHLIDAEFIRTPLVQRVFRAVDRGNYYHPNHKQSAYKDIAWRQGNLHLSAPCVYSVVMESLKLKPGLSFLNLGSGSGYLSTMVGLIIGRYGTNHGIEFHSDIVEYAYEKLDEFLKTSKIVDECDFCEPVFTTGNCLTLDNSQQYDRVYCGAACPEEYETYVKNLVKINGILIMPLNDKLLKITRVTETTWATVKILSVSFAPLILPPPIKKGEEIQHAKLSDITPPNLQQICRFLIRSTLRQNVDIEHPKLKLSQNKNESRPRRQVRRIVIPFFDESDLSNDQSDSDVELDSDSPEYTISSRLPSRMSVSVFLEDFLRRHAELQLLRQMEEDHHSSDSELDTNQPRKRARPERRKNTDTKTETADQQSSDTEMFSLITVSNIKQSHSSDESDSNFSQPPSQSTRSKRKNPLKRKRTNSGSSDCAEGPSKPSTSSSKLSRSSSKPGTSSSKPSTSSSKPSASSSKPGTSSSKPSTSSSSCTTEPRRKVKRTAATVVWKKRDGSKKDTEKKEAEEADSTEYDYTHFMIQKIGALPLPLYLLQYLNYRRNNM